MIQDSSPGSPGTRALALLCLAVLAGCATTPQTSCEQFEQARRSARYDTVYRYSNADTRLAAQRFAPVKRLDAVAVRWYTLRASRTQIGSCDHLYLTKDLYLLRKPNAAVTLLEQREFYTADGKLIATKREDVDGQLKITGFYSASVPLPIPRDAPSGAYRIVSRLIAKTADAMDRTLATASAEFQVQAREPDDVKPRKDSTPSFSRKR